MQLRQKYHFLDYTTKREPELINIVSDDER